MNRLPAQTSTSLLAKATIRPRRIAASVGGGWRGAADGPGHSGDRPGLPAGPPPPGPSRSPPCQPAAADKGQQGHRRDYGEKAVEPVEKAAMPRNEAARVLHAEPSFGHGLRKIAELLDNRKSRAHQNQR